MSTARKYFLWIWLQIAWAHSAPCPEIRSAQQLQPCTLLPAPLVALAAALCHSFSLPPTASVSPMSFARGADTPAWASSSHPPTSDQLCKHFALPDQITWLKVSHMMGHREIEKSELLWFHLSKVKHLNQQHFYVFGAWGLHFLIIPL